MSNDLAEDIDQLLESWPDGSNPGLFDIHEVSIGPEECSMILRQVESLREYIKGRSLIFSVEHVHDSFSYRLLWEPDGMADAEAESDQGLDSDSLFAGEEEQSSIQSLRRNRISGREEVEQILSPLAASDDVDIDARYSIDTEDIAEYFSSNLEYEVSTSYFFSVADFESYIQNLRVADIREELFVEQGKRLLIVRGVESHSYGKDIGIFSDKDLDSSAFEDFCERSETGREYIDDIRRECAIDYFDEEFVPPSYLEMEQGDKTRASRVFQEEMQPAQLLFSILSVSNIARKQENGWEIRINGTKVIESKFTITDDGGDLKLIEFDGDLEKETAVSEDILESFLDSFRWIYSARVGDRITVFRNIAAVHASTLSDLVPEIAEINKSARNTFRNYIRDSVEDFVEVQRDISSYIFETQREMSDLRRGLANNLSRDLFRVFGFTAVAWASIISAITEVSTLKAALSISLVPVIIYILLGLRSAHGLNQQYEAIKRSRGKYYDMYENRLDESVLDDIKEVDGSDTMDKEFSRDKSIYYGLFFGLLFGCVYIYADLAFHGPLIQFLLSL